MAARACSTMVPISSMLPLYAPESYSLVISQYFTPRFWLTLTMRTRSAQNVAKSSYMPLLSVPLEFAMYDGQPGMLIIRVGPKPYELLIALLIRVASQR